MATLADLQKQIADLQKKADSQRYTSYDRINRENDYKGTVQVDLDKAISNIDRRNLPHLPSTMAAYGKTKSELARLQKQYADMQKQAASQPQQPVKTEPVFNNPDLLRGSDMDPDQPFTVAEKSTGQPVDTGSEIAPQVVVYGPDGTSYPNPQAAIAAGVTNYTMTPPDLSKVGSGFSPSPDQVDDYNRGVGPDPYDNDPMKRVQQGTNNMTATDTTLKGKKGEELEEAVLQRQTEQADAASMSPPTAVTVAPQGVKPGELLTTTGKQTGTPTISTPQEVDAEAFATRAPTSVPAATYSARDVAPNLGNAEVAASVLSPGSIMQAAQGTATPESLATAAVQDMDPRATTQYQITELFKSIEDGKPLPAWAAPAVRAATAEMQKRGLGASSMAAAATVQAVMESGIPIAAQDAQKYATLQLQNLNNEQQAALQNATVLAAMDTANLNNRQQAQVANAKAFLTIDLQDMTNDQAAKTLTYKSKTTAMLSDAAATNAANQFNARTSNEVDLFFAELATNIEAASKNRVASIKQQNIAQKTAVEQFNAQMVANRDQFNSNMRMQIDQSNAVWRRSINTANTAAQNSANRENALNLLNINQASLNNLWQTYRDNAAWAMQISENTRERAHNAAMQSESIAYNSDSYDDKFNDYLILETIDNLFT